MTSATMNLMGKEVNVEDAKESVVLVITEDDCKQGQRKQAKHCAAAIALCRQFNVEAAMVTRTRAYVKTNGKWKRYTVPARLRQEIIAFDRGGEFCQGDFTIVAPTPSNKLSAHRERIVIKRKKKKKERKHQRREYKAVAGIRTKMNLKELG